MGTILPFTGNLSDIPRGWKLCDGSDGTPNLTGQFLQGSNTPGNFIAAALPNIKGTTLSVPIVGHSIMSGALLNTRWGGQYINSGHDGGSCSSFEFDASKYSSIYKNECDTVQPPAYTVYYIIKLG